MAYEAVSAVNAFCATETYDAVSEVIDDPADVAYDAVPAEFAYDAVADVLIVDGPFAGLEAIYQESDGERRVMVLIELMNRQVKVPLEPHQLAQRPS